MESFIQNITGGNTTIQTALISALTAAVTAIVVACISWYCSRKNLKMQEKQFKRKLKEQKVAFKEQCRQFEITLQNQQLIKYKELITTERIKWVSLLRENITEYLSMTHHLMQKKLTFIMMKEPEERKNELGKFLVSIEDDYTKLITLSYAIIDRLNPDKKNELDLGEIDHISFKLQLNLINDNVAKFLNDGTNEALDSYEYQKNTNIKIEEFSILCQKLLKYEWENTKKEAKLLYDHQL
ncbi:hypothetical protein SAMN05660742_12267 [Propionispira arboris]|uniref:Uncharacterized protein n=1 Tax=Propionispira arboris TaxID=84035 RepID=A0A1H7CSR7_9FIRM|nr:hypothetical protein [Propionispira arboris]SEJ89770.1 hypothetical protein SAMN05660742_12267 [Propionispira arboris]